MIKLVKEFSIVAPEGLHARPATLFVQRASRFAADMQVSFDDHTVNAKSIMGLMSLGLAQGQRFKLIISGSDCKNAMDSMISALEEEKIAHLVRPT